ncbi:MAG: transport acessory protein MmpS, partial [Mycobacterium sp.]|nr:transport acessory protein MmpS [Mycobacterium sp.]
MLGWMKRFWVVVVIVIALVAAVGVVSRLRTFFDSDKPYIGASQPADAIKPINTKRVTYQIVGPPDA